LEIVALARDHLSLRLARLVRESGLMAMYPAQFGDDRQANRLVIDMQRHRHTDPSVWGIDSQM
jgi:hypothetical protein